MPIMNEIKSIAVKKGLTLTYIADELSKRAGKHYSLSELSRKLRTNMIRYSELEIIADILGYKILLTENLR